MLQKSEIIAAVPANLRSSISDSLVDKINNAVNDPDEAEAIRNNFISYAVVLREGKFKVADYINAVMYVSYRLMDYNHEEAYARALPARYTELKSKGKTKKGSLTRMSFIKCSVSEEFQKLNNICFSKSV